jgi:hypothetical protein
LYEILSEKERLTTQLLKSIKESSIDCATHVQSNTKEGLVCLSFGQANNKDFAFNPNLSQDENDTVAALNKTVINWKGKAINTGGKQYFLRLDTRQVYDYDSVMAAQQNPGVIPILIGTLVERNGKYVIMKE